MSLPGDYLEGTVRQERHAMTIGPDSSNTIHAHFLNRCTARSGLHYGLEHQFDGRGVQPLSRLIRDQQLRPTGSPNCLRWYSLPVKSPGLWE